MSQPQLPAGVGLTAISVARERSVETERTDRLFQDEFAGAFCAAARRAAAGKSFPGLDSTLGNSVPMLRGYIALRTRYFDDQVLAACATGCRQVVALAAGLDARAFRLTWPQGVRYFELDSTEMHAFKRRVLETRGAQPQCERRTVAADLRADWPSALVSAGFSREAPTAWLLEGLLIYFTNEENDRLLSTIGQLSARGSQMTLEHADNQVLKQPVIAEIGSRTLAPEGVFYKSSVGDPLGWLKGHGWHPWVLDPVTYSSSLGRPVPPLLGGASGRLWLARATR